MCTAATARSSSATDLTRANTRSPGRSASSSMALRVASAKRWPCPSRSMETPASGPSSSLDAGDGAGERGAHAEILHARLGERDVGGPDDDARLAADRAGAAGEPDRARRVRDLGEVVCGIDRGKPAGHHRRPGEAAQPGAAQAGSKTSSTFPPPPHDRCPAPRRARRAAPPPRWHATHTRWGCANRRARIQ